jgi:hypothetical protein
MSGMHPSKSWLLSCKTRNRIAANDPKRSPGSGRTDLPTAVIRDRQPRVGSASSLTGPDRRQSVAGWFRMQRAVG